MKNEDFRRPLPTHRADCTELIWATNERETEMGLVDFFRCKRCDTALWAALFGVIGVCRGRLQGGSRQ